MCFISISPTLSTILYQTLKTSNHTRQIILQKSVQFSCYSGIHVNETVLDNNYNDYR